MQQKRLVSGIKPTGHIHLGNFFGAIKQLVSMQETHETFVFVANYHALTTTHDAAALREQTREVILDYLGAGLSPEEVVLYVQSDIAEHTELAWIFNCLTTVPYLKRAHAYKDAQEREHEISAGTFSYPLLMAADILLYDAAVVPVGQDQKQHLEIARDTAEKFNRTYADDLFTLPEPHIVSGQNVVPGIDGQKMSKSYNNTIPLFASDDDIRTQVFAIVTDSKAPDEPKDPDTSVICQLYQLVASADAYEQLRTRFVEGAIGYKEAKELLVDALIAYVTPLRNRRQMYADDPKEVTRILNRGREVAQQVARDKMRDIKKTIGLDYTI